MKTLTTLLFTALALVAQTLPTLPAFNTISAAGVTCTFSVIDNQMGLSSQCTDAAGYILHQGSYVANVKGAVTGTGPIMCLYWTDGAAPPTVRLQCSSDDDTGIGPKLALDGKLAPVNKKRVWYLFWR